MWGDWLGRVPFLMWFALLKSRAFYIGSPWGDWMFRGKTSISLDERGRMAIPARYRQMIQERGEGRLVITVDREDPCLLLYAEPDWFKVEEQLATLSNISRSARMLQRLLIGHATDVEMDGQGRVLIPQTLRTYAGIEKKVTVLGQLNKFEIWSEASWEAQLKESADPLLMEEDLEQLGRLQI